VQKKNGRLNAIGNDMRVIDRNNVLISKISGRDSCERCRGVGQYEEVLILAEHISSIEVVAKEQVTILKAALLPFGDWKHSCEPAARTRFPNNAPDRHQTMEATLIRDDFLEDGYA
jgi:hypothetical protein